MFGESEERSLVLLGFTCAILVAVSSMGVLTFRLIDENRERRMATAEMRRGAVWEKKMGVAVNRRGKPARNNFEIKLEDGTHVFAAVSSECYFKTAPGSKVSVMYMVNGNRRFDFYAQQICD